MRDDRDEVLAELAALLPPGDYVFPMRTRGDVGDPLIRLSFGNVAETYHRVRPPYSQDVARPRAGAARARRRRARARSRRGNGTADARARAALRARRRRRAERRDARADRGRRRPRRRGRGDPARGRERRRGLRRRGVPLVRRAARDRGDRARAPSARRARDRLDALVGDRAAAARRGAGAAARAVGALRRAAQRRRWDDAFAESPFEPLRYERFEEAIAVDPDELLELYSTTSSLAALSRGRARRALRAACARCSAATTGCRSSTSSPGRGSRGEARGRHRLRPERARRRGEARARQGVHVTVHEAAATIGGGCRTAELTLPGFRHDVCAAVLPLARSSPAFAGLDVEWIDPPVPAAHALDGDAVTLERALAGHRRRPRRRRAELPRARRAVRPRVAEALVAPGPPSPAPVARPRPAQRARDRAAVRHRARTCALRRATPRTRCCRSSARRARASGSRSARPRTSTAGRSRAADRRRSSTRSPRASSLGGEIDDVEPRRRAAARGRRALRRRAARVRRARGAPARRYARSRFPPRAGGVQARLGARRADPVDERGVPRARRRCTSAGTFAEIAASERAPWEGRGAGERPFVLLAQQSLFDDSRAPAGKHTAWAYCHVPNGWDGDATDAIEAQVERFAPGFRELILARHVDDARATSRRTTANDVGGDIVGGANTLRQLAARPTLARRSRGARRCAASTSARRRRRRAAACTASAASRRRASRCATFVVAVTAGRRRRAATCGVSSLRRRRCRSRRSRPPRARRLRGGRRGRCGCSLFISYGPATVAVCDSHAHGQLDRRDSARAPRR